MVARLESLAYGDGEGEKRSGETPDLRGRGVGTTSVRLRLGSE